MEPKTINNLSHSETKELDAALEDIQKGENLEGPFHSAEEFILSLKK